MDTGYAYPTCFRRPPLRAFPWRALACPPPPCGVPSCIRMCPRLCRAAPVPAPPPARAPAYARAACITCQRPAARACGIGGIAPRILSMQWLLAWISVAQWAAGGRLAAFPAADTPLLFWKSGGPVLTVPRSCPRRRCAAQIPPTSVVHVNGHGAEHAAVPQVRVTGGSGARDSLLMRGSSAGR